MIQILIGLGFLGFGISLCFYEKSEFFGVAICILTFIYLLIHIPTWLLASHKYERHIVERNSMIESLENARLTKNNIELAAISKDIIEYNKDLALLKYDNTGILDCYIDDRFINLKPIK